MSMTAGTRASRAAEVELTTHQEVASAESNRHYWRRYLPSRADGWSSLMAILFAALVPAWFVAAGSWHSGYSPVRPWVWTVPWIITWLYFAIQMLCLLRSAVDSDRIGMADMTLSLLALMSVFATVIVLTVLSVLGRYVLGGFQIHEMAALLSTALLELACTAWVRFLVNRRTFAAVAGSEHHGS